jgi:uncharacterized membrane protein YtjA (UPF0391 family)
MLYYVVVLPVIALLGAVFGVGELATGAAWIAKILFVVFLVLFLATAVAGMLRRRGNG